MDNENYTISFLKRQEDILIEQIRKTIDLEIKLSFANDKIKELTAQFEESQKQIEIQNGMMQQAADSIKTLTLTRDNNENKIKNLETSVNDLRAKTHKLEEELRTQTSKASNFEREVNRQQTELQQLFEENEQLKKNKDQKLINKKKTQGDFSSEEF